MQPPIDEVKQRLLRAFQPEAAAGIDRVYQFHIGGERRFHIEVQNGVLTVSPGAHAEPSVTLLFPDVDTALALIEGRLDPMQAFLEGRIRSDGNLILALQLRALFWR